MAVCNRSAIWPCSCALVKITEGKYSEDNFVTVKIIHLTQTTPLFFSVRLAVRMKKKKLHANKQTEKFLNVLKNV